MRAGPMPRRVSKHAVLALAGVSFPALLASFLLEGSAATWLQALLVTFLPVALMAVGASRRGRLEGRLPLLLTVIWVVLAAAALALVALSGRPAERGLPAATWMLIVGLGLVPLLLTSWVYAVTFPGGGAEEGRERPPGSSAGPGERP